MEPGGRRGRAGKPGPGPGTGRRETQKAIRIDPPAGASAGRRQRGAARPYKGGVKGGKRER